MEGEGAGANVKRLRGIVPAQCSSEVARHGGYRNQHRASGDLCVVYTLVGYCAGLYNRSPVTVCPGTRPD